MSETANFIENYAIWQDIFLLSCKIRELTIVPVKKLQLNIMWLVSLNISKYRSKFTEAILE